MKQIVILCTFLCLLLSSCQSKEDLLSKKIQKMASCAELGTVEYTVTKIIKASDDAWYKYGDRKILFTCTAFLKAGIDLNNISKDNVKINSFSKSIDVVLPKAKLLSFNMPPELIEEKFSQVSGLRFSFTPEEKQDLKVQGEKAILEDLDNLGILKEAEKNATEFFNAFLSRSGYETINIKFE